MSTYGVSVTGVSVPAVTLPPSPVVFDPDDDVSTLTLIGAGGPQPRVKVMRRVAAMAAIILVIFTSRLLREMGGETDVR